MLLFEGGDQRFFNDAESIHLKNVGKYMKVTNCHWSFKNNKSIFCVSDKVLGAGVQE